MKLTLEITEKDIRDAVRDRMEMSGFKESPRAQQTLNKFISKTLKATSRRRWKSYLIGMWEESGACSDIASEIDDILEKEEDIESMKEMEREALQDPEYRQYLKLRKKFKETHPH